MSATAPVTLTNSAIAEAHAIAFTRQHGTEADVAGVIADIKRLREQNKPPLILKLVPKGLGILSTQYTKVWVPAPMPKEGPGSDAWLAKGIAGLPCQYLRKYGQVCQDNVSDMIGQVLGGIIIGGLTAGLGQTISSGIGGDLGATLGDKAAGFAKGVATQELVDPGRNVRTEPAQVVEQSAQRGDGFEWVIPAVVVAVVVVALVATKKV